MVNLEPIVFTGRVFLKGKKWGQDYDAVFTVQRTGNVGYVSGLHGKISKDSVLELGEELAKYGITEMKWRKGRDI